MKEITKIMIKKYELELLKYDFMGYVFNNKGDLSYHHLIVPRRLNGPETIQNGAILVQKTAHDYLHIIERYDTDMYNAIQSEMIDENIQGHLDMDNISRINDILECFEREYSGLSNKKGKELIKPDYVYTRMLKKGS